MAVYEANIRSLAEFISDTKLGFIPCGVESTIGSRKNNENSTYKISAHKIKCDRIYVVNDCFIDMEGNIVVTSYIPAIKYYLITNELSSCYGIGENLSFGYSTNSQILNYEISKDTKLNTYDEFKVNMEKLIRFIEQNIEEMMNEFKDGSWKIKNVVCNIKWQVDKIKQR